MKYAIFISIFLSFITQSFAQSSCASRTSGVAPLMVHFDAVDTTNGVVQPTLSNGRREYADFRYEWDFGDSNSGTWAVNSKSKNTDEGYITAHVFDNPGVYTVTLKVTDIAENEYSYTETITVLDPDVVYAGNKTVCISSTGNFTGAPSGSLNITSSNIMDIFSHVDDSMRILLRRGDSWTTANGGTIGNIDGPLTIGAYGTGTNPDDWGIFQNAPLINLDGSATLFNTNNSDDIRIMDLEIAGSTSSEVFAGNTDIGPTLMYRLKTNGHEVPLGNFFYNTQGHDNIAVVNCHITEAEKNTAFLGSERLVLMGNFIRNPHESHVVRVWQSYKGVIAHNDMSGSSSQSGLGRHALKLHGPSEHDILTIGLTHRTRYTVIANNTIGGSGPYPVIIAPQNTSKDERIQDIVFENNRVIADYGIVTTAPQLGALVAGNYITLRNNVFDGSGSNSSIYLGIVMQHYGTIPQPLGNRVYNNTIYKTTPVSGGATLVGIDVRAGVLQSLVQNNLVQFVNSGSVRTAVRDNGTGSTLSHNILTTDASLIDPSHANPLLRNFNIDSLSLAIDSGITLPLRTDFLGNDRPKGNGFDVGAFEFDPGSNGTCSLTINGTDTQTACDSLIWIDGNTYTSSTNTPTFNIVGGAANGCDSLVTLNLTINNSTTGTDDRTACDSFTWIDGNTYTASTNTPTFTLTNSLGCDSTVTLNLTINNSTTGTDTQIACDSFTWIDGNTYTSSTNTPTFTLTNSLGCDSTVTLNLTVNNSTTGTDRQKACDSFIWIDGNTYTSSTNTPTFTLTNSNGCDSIVTLDLTINTVSDLTISINELTLTANNTNAKYQWLDCNKDFAILSGEKGQTYTAISSGSYAVELTENGCVDTTDCVSIISSSGDADIQTACDSLTWIDGNTYYSNNNTATFNILGGETNGHNSFVTLNLTIINSSVGTDIQTACDSFIWIDGNTYTSSTNTPTFTLTNSLGCDSIVTLDLTINTISDLTISTSEPTLTVNNTSAKCQWLDCSNDFAIVPGETGQTYTAISNGNYAVELTENGCIDTTDCVSITTNGILENQFGQLFKVYPNPTNGDFAIDLGDIYHNITIEIKDLGGKTIQSYTYEQGQLIELSIKEPSGIYLVSLQSGHRDAIIRLIKR